MKTCFCHLSVVWRPLAEERLVISTQSNASLKSTYNGLQFLRWQYGSIFIRLAVIAYKTREMSRNSKRFWPYSSSWSSKVIDLGVSGKLICDFLLVITVIVTLAVSATVFEIFALKDRKLLILPTPLLFDAPARGDPLEFLVETYPAITRGTGLPYGENFMILTSIIFTARCMHFSAKHGIAIACRLSVRLSVCNVGELWSHRLEFFENNFIIS